MRQIKNIYHLVSAIIANIVYGFPSRGVTMIGVTGTDGKTTTSSLIYHILKKSGKKVAMITTVGAYIGDQVYDVGFHVTTPSAFALQQYIQKAKAMGNEYIVLEVTSHALSQYRAWGIHFAVSVLTNITHEHLDYHRTYDAYVRAKARLFYASDLCILNGDDQSYAAIVPLLNNKHIQTYRREKNADVTGKNFPFETKLFGTFNQSNCLAAISVLKHMQISDADIRRGLASFTPPVGRQEIIYDKEFMVMVDFAHTPNAFANILPEVARVKKHRLIHVFGSAGLRDATKRPLMGRESDTYADIIILTAEDPRVESVADINAAIISGFTSKRLRWDLGSKDTLIPGKKYFMEIPDREQAITTAIQFAQKGDLVIVTGKAHEKSMNYGSGEEAWDEFAVIKKALSAKK